MRKLLLTLVALAAPALALAESWDKVPIVDHMCQEKVHGDTSKHPTSCLLRCASSGYSIQAGGTWLKLDDAGNQQAIAALKKTSRTNDVRVNVTGERQGDTVKVTALTIPD